MNLLPCPFLLSLLLLMAWTGPSRAQDVGPTDADTAPAGSTVITSDELRSDQNTHISVFTGNVVVVGNNFNLTCQEMTVVFDKDNKVDTITATGNVVITQPERITHCGQAQYFHDEDKFVLTDEPVIVDKDNNQIKAPRIIIYRTKQLMITEGGRSTTILSNKNGSGVGTPSPAPAAPAGTP